MARPKTERGRRPRRSITAYDDEYAVIERFISAVKDNPQICASHLAKIEAEIKAEKIREYANTL